MNCLIDNALKQYVSKGRKPDVIRRYIRMKYSITIDRASMLERIKALNTPSGQHLELS